MLLALVLTGCETTAEKSAKLEKVAEQQQSHALKSGNAAQRGVSVTKASTRVKVGATAVLDTAEGAAVVVRLHNVSSIALRNVPIEIVVKDARGTTVYTNDTPGLGAGLTSVAWISAHSTLSWVDDQVQSSSAPASVTATVGEGTPTAEAVPQLDVEGTHLIEDPSSGPAAEGSVANRSQVGQQELVVSAVARRGGAIVAAGRAVLPMVPAHASTRFQLFFIGNPHGARLEVSAPADTLG